MNNNENTSIVEDEGVSLGEIFSWIWRKKILGLILFLVVALVSFLAIYFIGNRSVQYTVSFDYGNTPRLEEGSHLDGSTFNYLSLISRESLNEVKSNEEFASIDVNELLKSISITETNVYDSTNTTQLVDNYYVLSANASNFSSDEQARNFFLALINSPIDYNQTYLTSLNFESGFSLIEQSRTYEDELTYINNQVNLIINGYNSLIGEFGDVSVPLSNANGNYIMSTYEEATSYFTLSQIQSNINITLNSYNYNYLSDILASNNYIKISDTSDLTANNPDIIYYQTMYNSRVNALLKANEELKAQVDALTQQINEVLNSGNGNIIDSAALQSLIERRSNYQEQIVNNNNNLKIIQGEDGLGGILNHITEELAKGEEAFKADIAFGTTLDEIVTLLENETSTYTSIYKSLYANRFNVNYRNAGIIDTAGGISLIINLAISVVLGLIVGAVVAGIVGYNDTKKDKPKKIKEVELKA